jgi:hypothetical protein
MPKFLFWNLGGSPRTDIVRHLVVENGIDVVMLAECGSQPADMLVVLNQERSNFQYAPGLCDRIMFFTAFDSSFVQPLYENSRVSIRRLTLPARQPILLASAHLPSKLHFSDASQPYECVALADEIARLEQNEGHRRTLLMGDLNVNPFEDGIVAARGLNAVMSRRIALRNSRTVQGRSYPFFYNPMWNHFGDDEKPGGTFYYEKAEHVVYYWNLFDQALIRPDLVQTFNQNQVQILTVAGGNSLIDENGRPDPEVGSDHLPIAVELNF